MAVRDDFSAGEVLSAGDLNDTFASKLDLAGGKILQVVRAAATTTQVTSSTSFVDAGISVTITPQKSDSSVILIWSNYTFISGGPTIITLAITDSSNNIIPGGSPAIGTSTAGILSFNASNQVFARSTPATTSATTYKGRFKVNANTGHIDNASSTGQMFAIEVSA